MVDPATGISTARSARDHTQVMTLREAKELTALPADMDQYTNFYENKLLEAMMEPGNSNDA